MMPLGRHHTARGFDGSRYRLMQFVAQPDMIEPLVLLVAEVQRIAAAQALVRLPVLVEVRRTHVSAAGRTAQEQDVALPHPQKHAHPSAAFARVIGARAQ